MLVTLPHMSPRKARLPNRSCDPRDYLEVPERFGCDDTARTVFPTPPDGDDVLQKIALVQHQLVFVLTRTPNSETAKFVTDKFGFSTSQWSLCLSGKAWMGETVLAAAVSVLLNRRSLRPRDYLSEPARFGRDVTIGTVLPSGGDVLSQRVALVQHQLVFAMGYPPDRGTATRVTRSFHLSKRQWRLCLLGEAWMGKTVLAAAVKVLLDAERGH